MEAPDRFEVALASDDGVTSMSVRARLAAQLPASSVFRTLDAASAFFQAGALGYSATSRSKRASTGWNCTAPTWHVEPLEVEEVRSSFFDDEALFPKGSIAFDCALLMRGLQHEWHGQADFVLPASGGPPRSRRRDDTRKPRDERSDSRGSRLRVFSLQPLDFRP